MNQNRKVKYKLLILCLLNGLGFVGLSQPKKAVIQASNEEFANLIMEYSNEIIIDVRDTAFYNNQIIQGAILVPTQAQLNQLVDSLDLDTPLLVYCSVGIRSKKACEVLVKLGFKTIINLEKGLDKWREKQFPVETIP